MPDAQTTDIDTMDEQELREALRTERANAPQRAYGRSGAGPGGGIGRLTNEATGEPSFGEFQQDVARRFNSTETGPMSRRGGPDAPSFRELSDYAAGQLGRHLTKRLLAFNSRLKVGLAQSGVDVEALRQELGG